MNSAFHSNYSMKNALNAVFFVLRYENGMTDYSMLNMNNILFL